MLYPPTDVPDPRTIQTGDPFETLPPHVQACISSAITLPEILDLATEFVRDAVRVPVSRANVKLWRALCWISAVNK